MLPSSPTKCEPYDELVDKNDLYVNYTTDSPQSQMGSNDDILYKLPTPPRSPGSFDFDFDEALMNDFERILEATADQLEPFLARNNITLDASMFHDNDQVLRDCMWSSTDERGIDDSFKQQQRVRFISECSDMFAAAMNSAVLPQTSAPDPLIYASEPLTPASTASQSSGDMLDDASTQAYLESLINYTPLSDHSYHQGVEGQTQEALNSSVLLTPATTPVKRNFTPAIGGPQISRATWKNSEHVAGSETPSDSDDDDDDDDDLLNDDDEEEKAIDDDDEEIDVVSVGGKPEITARRDTSPTLTVYTSKIERRNNNHHHHHYNNNSSTNAIINNSKNRLNHYLSKKRSSTTFARHYAASKKKRALGGNTTTTTGGDDDYLPAGGAGSYSSMLSEKNNTSPSPTPPSSSSVPEPPMPRVTSSGRVVQPTQRQLMSTSTTSNSNLSSSRQHSATKKRKRPKTTTADYYDGGTSSMDGFTTGNTTASHYASMYHYKRARKENRPARYSSSSHHHHHSNHRHSHHYRSSYAASLSSSSSRSNSDNEDPIERRREHNSMERKRRDDLRFAFQRLRETVPGIEDNPKAPKVTILEHAAAFSRQITMQHHRLEKSLVDEQKRFQQLQKKLKLLQQQSCRSR